MTAQIEELLRSGRVLDVFTTQLGVGGAREAYGSERYPDLVAKRLYYPLAGTNAKEWANWNKIVDTAPDLAKWFAPCVAYDEDQHILIMKRTSPIPRRKRPIFLPSCHSDNKPGNFGIYQGRFVCHDYAVIGLHKGPYGWYPDAPIARGWRMAPWSGGVREGADPNWRENPTMDFFDRYFDHYHEKVVPGFPRQIRGED